MLARSILRTVADAGHDALVAWYFAFSYRALATPAGSEFLRSSAPPDMPAVHGYSTSEDLTALLEALQPSPDDLVVDLGCGFGEAAIAVHRRTGCRVVGIDASPRAIAEARRRAHAADVEAAVRYDVGALGAMAVRGSAAFALDSFMFVRQAPEVLASVSRSLEPPGLVFATFIDHRGRDSDSFARYIAGAGLKLERLDDVTAEFAARSRARAATAKRVFSARPAQAGRLGLLLVLAEEAVVTWLIERRRLRRWRFAAVHAKPLTGDTSIALTSR
jgi:SAM-dependent methyltransferase